MKNKLLLSSLILFTFISLNAQWSGTNPLWTNSSVGIGISTPSYPLDVRNATGQFQLKSTTGTNNVVARFNNSGGDLLFGRENSAGASLVSSSSAYSSVINSLGTYPIHFAVNNIISMTMLNGGNVGIGTNLPVAPLHLAYNEDISAANQWRYPLFIETNDKVGGLWQGTGVGQKFHLSSSNANFDVAEIVAVAPTAGTTNGDLYFRTALAGSMSNCMIIQSNGNVGIGTITPGNYKLNVSGRVRANEVVVNTTGADFVFEPDYKLPSLQEVESYIRKNKHLPGLSSASEMQKNGLNVSQMQTRLLQKVEELTIYLIELSRQVESLKKENDLLRTQNNSLSEEEQKEKQGLLIK